MSVPRMFTSQKPNRALEAGDILLGRLGGVTYLVEKAGTLCGCDEWVTARYTAAGTPIPGSMSFARDGSSVVLGFVPETEFTSDSRMMSARCQKPGEHGPDLAGAVVDCDRPEHHEPGRACACCGEPVEGDGDTCGECVDCAPGRVEHP